MPSGRLTPTIEHAKVLSKALELRDAMKDCILSDRAIQLIALRVNTGASVAQLARGVGMDRTAAYVMLSRPQAQQLIADLARALMGDAAIMGAHTMMRIMRSKDSALAYRAASEMMERAGLGISQRATPDGETKTVFAFAFGAPQASSTVTQHVAPVDKMGPIGSPAEARGASKTGTSLSGEATSPVILEPGTALLPSRAARAKTVRRS
jgi:hypothetical protein